MAVGGTMPTADGRPCRAWGVTLGRTADGPPRLNSRQIRFEPGDRSALYVDEVVVAQRLFEITAGPGRAAAGTANQVRRAIRIDLFYALRKLGQREIHRASGMNLGVLIGFADIDELGIFWNLVDCDTLHGPPE